MHKRSIILTCLSIFVAAAMLAGCAGMSAAPAPTQQNFKPPVVTLDSMEVAHAFGYWYFSNKVQPTKGNPDNVGAPLELAFIFNVENPNEYPVKMENLKFTIAFEEFDLNTVSSTETMWIPAGKTNELRVPAMFDTRQTLLTLLLPGAMMLKEKGVTPWDELEKWWTGAPDFSFPVSVKEGSAIFKAGDVVKVVPFEATFP